MEAGRAVVVDIDGVLSDAATRQHYLEAPRRDWQAFFEACGDDPVIEEMRVLLDLLEPGIRVVLLTARPARVHHLTAAWLARYKVRWDLLIMRDHGDYSAAREFKQWTLHELRQAGLELVLAFEDDRRNRDMFHREGKLALMLQNRCIVETLELGQHDGRHFITMEHIGDPNGNYSYILVYVDPVAGKVLENDTAIPADASISAKVRALCK